tara:strand:+ start:2139 stop:2354 length:216 start_codon:yes stop_codon:yes gene_type:complete
MQVYEIEKTSPLTGKVNTMEIKMNPNDYVRWQKRETNIQDALPYLSVDEREFLMSGISPEDWNELYPASVA